MTKEEFEELQLDIQKSGKPLMSYLHDFPNGLRAHFGSGTEGVLLELLNKSLSAHVLPE